MTKMEGGRATEPSRGYQNDDSSQGLHKHTTPEAPIKLSLTPAQAFQEIETRRISLTNAFDGRLWMSSIERVRRKRPFTKPEMEIVSATAPTPVRAVTDLVEKLKAEERTPEKRG